MSLPLSTKLTINKVAIDQPLGLFINNEFVKPKNGKTFESINPSTEEVITELYAADAEDVDIAVAAARKAFKSWKKVSGTERSKLLSKLSALFTENLEVLSTIEAADSGKPRAQNALGDIEECADILQYYAGWADKIKGSTLMESTEHFAYTRHQPFGVCGQIIPWNYPLAMAIWKIAPAIATGNTVVLKSAEQTPLSVLYAAKLVVEAGFPPGVINIISGFGKDVGTPLASHMDVDKIAFTGSTATGKIIMELAAKSNLKAVTLECGGKSALLAFDDCDLVQTAKWAVAGIMFNQGQVCSATSRLYIQDTIYEEFLKEMAKQVEELVIRGDVFDDEVVQGPQVTKVQRDRVLSYIEAGIQAGARVVCGGGAVDGKGYYIKPTVFADCTEDMKIVREEIFGPVAVVMPFKTEEEAIERANSSEYGLAGAVFTQNITRAHRVANELDAGTIWVNSSNDQDFRIPFGGFKMSGVGTELGEYGLNTYTVVKSVQINLGNEL